MGGMGKRRVKIKIEHAEDRFFRMVKEAKNFPTCYGKYPDCPQEVMAFAGRKFKREEVPRDCELCPFFRW
jgi:hypothetical protein